MIILNEKQPPPPYVSATPAPPPFQCVRAVPKLDGLPPHVLLLVVNMLFPSTTVDATIHRKTLYWVAMSLRLVSRGLYIGSLFLYSACLLHSPHVVRYVSMYAYPPVSLS